VELDSCFIGNFIENEEPFSAGGLSFEAGVCFEVVGCDLEITRLTLKFDITSKIRQSITIPANLVNIFRPYKYIPDTTSTISIRGPHDEVIGSEDVDEMAKSLEVQSAEDRTPGVFVRGRSGKAYPLFKILKKMWIGG